MLILQASFTTGEYIPFIDYIEHRINKLVKIILNFKKIDSMLKIREIIFNIIQLNVDINYIINNILHKLINEDISTENKIKIITIIANAEHKYVCGDRKIIHLEYCIIFLLPFDD